MQTNYFMLLILREFKLSQKERFCFNNNYQSLFSKYVCMHYMYVCAFMHMYNATILLV